MKDEVDHVNDESFDGNVPGSEKSFKQQLSYEDGIALCVEFILEVKSKSLMTHKEQADYLKSNYTPEEQVMILQVGIDLQKLKSRVTPEMLGE